MQNVSLSRLLFLISFLLQCYQQEEISTTSGRVTGITIKVFDKDIYAYYGIPFALPPIRNLRFQEPQLVKPLDYLYRAIQKPPACMQKPLIPDPEWWLRSPKNVSEDCLYLNIWVPKSKKDGERFTTMVWIHGGLFHMGSSNMDTYDGRVIAALGNVIVVNFNYRLGAFGYADFDQEGASGNMGMLDQVMALKWVHQNIESFGGDKQLITIFGQSSGAISGAHHLISPLTTGLFKRAILQSGSNYQKMFAVDPEVNVKSTRVVSEYSGCSGEDILNCMRNVTASKIVSAEATFFKNKKAVMTFPPENGGKYLPKIYFHAMNSGKFHDVEVMMGENKDEGSLFLAFHRPDLFLEGKPVLSKENAKSIIDKISEVDLDAESRNRIWNKYIGNLQEESSLDVVKQTAKVFGDGAFSCPIFQLAEKLSEYNRTVYHYTFNYARKKSMFKEWMGITHQEDIAFVFGLPLLRKNKFTSEEMQLSKRIIELWTSFAKTGKPSYTGMKEEWRPFDTGSCYSLYITLENTYNEVRPEGVCKFWKEIFPPN